MEIPETCEVMACTESALYVDIEGRTLRQITCLEHCIIPELKMLWDAGIKTFCSCCGHGNDDVAYIRVDAGSAGKMLAMGYEPFERHACPLYTDTVSFRAKGIKQARDAWTKQDSRSVEEIRKMWRDRSQTKGVDLIV